ncbi:MAG: hypothetical protein ACRD4V_11420 [Candidatus Acidiferrales bacterium]
MHPRRAARQAEPPWDESEPLHPPLLEEQSLVSRRHLQPSQALAREGSPELR